MSRKFQDKYSYNPLPIDTLLSEKFTFNLLNGNELVTYPNNLYENLQTKHKKNKLMHGNIQFEVALRAARNAFMASHPLKLKSLAGCGYGP